jgi:hypothetical protein
LGKKTSIDLRKTKNFIISVVSVVSRKVISRDKNLIPKMLKKKRKNVTKTSNWDKMKSTVQIKIIKKR